MGGKRWGWGALQRGALSYYWLLPTTTYFVLLVTTRCYLLPPIDCYLVLVFTYYCLLHTSGFPKLSFHLGRLAPLSRIGACRPGLCHSCRDWINWVREGEQPGSPTTNLAYMRLGEACGPDPSNNKVIGVL